MGGGRVEPVAFLLANERSMRSRGSPTSRSVHLPRSLSSRCCGSRPTVGEELRITHDELRSSPLVESRTSDFHCVTTWTARRQRWTGVALAVWWRECGAPSLAEAGDFAVVRGYDGHQAVFRTDDLFADDVMLAWELDHATLDARHGFPLRLVSPSQYGYKNVKHVESIELRDEQPASLLGAKEHLRARVAREERHSRLPGRLVRWPYRLLVPVTAMVAERTLHRSGASGSNH